VYKVSKVCKKSGISPTSYTKPIKMKVAESQPVFIVALNGKFLCNSARLKRQQELSETVCISRFFKKNKGPP